MAHSILGKPEDYIKQCDSQVIAIPTILHCPLVVQQQHQLLTQPLHVVRKQETMLVNISSCFVRPHRVLNHHYSSHHNLQKLSDMTDLLVVTDNDIVLILEIV